MILLLFFLPLAFVGSVISQKVCDVPVDLGTENCTSSNSSIRFYYEESLKRCLPFRYSGCGGNKNNYEDFRQCRQRCVPLDHLFCPANSPPLPNAAGQTNCGKQPNDPKCATPSLSYCQEGPNGVGLCCSLDSQQKVNKDREPLCSNGKKKYSVFKGGKDRIVLGRICLHNFCPEGYECQQGIFYAYCCAK